MYVLRVCVVADQMDGSQQRHAHYREQICDFMRANRADFEPFIVEQSFDAFVRSLSQDGTFGGNECLVAFSRLYDTRICIHQVMQRRDERSSNGRTRRLCFSCLYS